MGRSKMKQCPHKKLANFDLHIIWGQGKIQNFVPFYLFQMVSCVLLLERSFFSKQFSDKVSEKRD